MGAKASKFEGEYLPATPTLKLKSATIPRFAHKFDEDNKDPRSPSGCRTPVGLYHIASESMEMQESVVQRAQISTTATTTTTTNKENPFVLMRKRFLKNFISNDPRSPQTDRTPIIFDECIDRTLNLDDTFADLFVDSRAPLAKNVEKTEEQEISVDNASLDVHYNNSSIEIMSLPYDEEETMPCPASLQCTPLKLQQLDPRSPTVGVDRTPIIFGDEDEKQEEQMLENILETLTLNLSNDSSMASFVSANDDGFMDMKETEAKHDTETEEPQQQQHIETNLNQITNKHLERVRFGKKQRMPPRKPVRLRHQQLQHQQIYEDINDNPPENVKTNVNLSMKSTTTSTPKSTPKKSFVNGINKLGSTTKRTPLSCVKNQAHLRSRSVENSNKKLRSQLPLKSFDDQLNPVRCINMPSLHILQNAEDSMDASIF